MTAVVVGIDPSLTGTTLAMPDDSCFKVDTKTFTGARRLVIIREAVLSALRNASQWKAHDPLVVLEGYAFARPNQAHQIGELGGVLRVALHEHGIRWIEVAPQARAKWATGKGNASKDAVVSAVSARLGRVFESNDHVDAWVLRDIGVALTTGVTALGEITKARAEVLTKLEVPA